MPATAVKDSVLGTRNEPQREAAFVARGAGALLSCQLLRAAVHEEGVTFVVKTESVCDSGRQLLW